MLQRLCNRYNLESTAGTLFVFILAVICFWLAFQQRFAPKNPIARLAFVLCGSLLVIGVYIGLRYPIQQPDRRVRIYDQEDPHAGELEILKPFSKDSECVGRLSVKEEKEHHAYKLHLRCAEDITREQLRFFQTLKSTSTRRQSCPSQSM